MNDKQSKIDLKLKKVLWACNKYWYSLNIAQSEKLICYSWIKNTYQKKFNESFHHSALRKLTQLGFLKKVDTSRGGRRCYYKIINPQKPSSILNQ